MYSLSVDDGRVVSGVTICNNCDGDVDANAGLLWLRRTDMNGQPTLLQLLNVSSGFSELWRLAARHIADDDAPMCPCHDSVDFYANSDT
jgi:hypothetical protein